MITTELDWRDDLTSAIKNHEELEAFFEQQFPRTTYPIFIPKTWAQRIKKFGVDSPLGKQFLPHEAELDANGMIDPIGDHNHSPTKQVVHRYSNRLLFFPTSVCPVQCRYCFRKNELHTNDELFRPDFEGVSRYVRDNPEVEEIIFSGGDPLMLSNDKLAKCFDHFSQLKVPMIRLHTRMPVIMPERLDHGFFELLESAAQKFDVITVVLHLNHVDEISQELVTKMQRFRGLNIHWLSQSVLLKDVNDNTSDLKNLFMGLLKIGVKPYYLHHPDQVRGGMHFWLSIEKGRKIFASLRNQLPGHAIPQYVLDIPGGEGKVPLFNPEGFEFGGHLLNKNGELTPYFYN
tara:strand:- start:12289 stop:13326 length:1038 start_codon:yes stop_codon:yes gene_type:complete